MEYHVQVYQEQKRSRKYIVVAAIVSAVLAALIAGSGVYFYMCVQMEAWQKRVQETLESSEKALESLQKDFQADLDERLEEIRKTAENNKPEETGGEAFFSVADVAQKVKPSVVQVNVYVPSYRSGSGYRVQTVAESFGSGSGILYQEAEGKTFVLTNYHVVEAVMQYEGVKITVVLGDDATEYRAAFVGGDSTNDLAVLSIEATGLPLAEMGNSDDLRVGDVAIVIGNPLGEVFAGSVTVGYISALNRNISGENGSETLIQTDAAINPGNSGGALVNARGQIVGITSSKIASSDVEGLGFAIPIDYALPIVNDLISYGYVKGRACTGISDGQSITEMMSYFYGYPVGFYVTQVEDGSGAALAGLKKGDVLVSVDGTAVFSLADIQKINRLHTVGDQIVVRYYRNGTYEETSLILGEDRGI